MKMNKNELNEIFKKVKAISTKGLTKEFIKSSVFIMKQKKFSLLIFQSYLLFIPTKKIIEYFSGTTRIESWMFNGISNEIIENVTKSDRNFAPTFVEPHLILDMNFRGQYF